MFCMNCRVYLYFSSTSSGVTRYILKFFVSFPFNKFVVLSKHVFVCVFVCLLTILVHYRVPQCVYSIPLCHRFGRVGVWFACGLKWELN